MYALNTPFTIRKATVADIRTIAELLPPGDQRIGFGKTTMSQEKFIEYLHVCITFEHHETYLYYKGDQLYSMLSCYDSAVAPWWCALNFKVFKIETLFDATQNGWVDLGDHIAKIKESQGRYSFFYVKTVRDMSKLMKKKYAKEYTNNFSQTGIGNRYINTIEEYIPAGQESKYEFFKKTLLRNQIFLQDVAISKWTCLQEFRTGMPDYLQDQTLDFSRHLKL
jgi:hypothetical protein